MGSIAKGAEKDWLRTRKVLFSFRWPETAFAF